MKNSSFVLTRIDMILIRTFLLFDFTEVGPGGGVLGLRGDGYVSEPKFENKSTLLETEIRQFWDP